MPKVLLADDDFTMVALLKTLLGMEGYEVETLLDKTGGLLKNIRAIKPDIFLVDIFLGDQNGLELVKILRKEADLQEIKVIMASGIDKSEECKKAGADAFLLKPYMPDDLFSILRSLSKPDNA